MITVVKQVASIFRSIFYAYVNNVSSYPVIAIKVSKPDSANRFTVYEPVIAYDRRGVPGYAAIPADMPESMKRAFLAWNECDLVVQALLPSLEAKLSARIPGVRVDWLNVDIAPVFLFRNPDSDANVPDPTHSSFLITLPHNRGKYVADFTIEQFGFGEECWFLPFEDYMTRTRDCLYEIYNFEERNLDLKFTFSEDRIKGQRLMRKLGRDLDWAIAEQLAESDRAAVIDDMARRALYEEWVRWRAYA
ncbi:uncharacterized protein N0V89_006949 [Didymosphaeria variabile]|uniref:Uncharacterized protein n=1 Tax=Didymosphaeria variabile TaxID=1932322 RepID=A0A9W8XJX5_9PLEO|nr:uncharacterized protein N0V89_006949 [Didymosphaeria variabile]KAJ4351606.1 hypothetical protein N0V89_006949 [Didymosphaeria variabile]